MDLQTLLQEHEELQVELRGSTEKAKKASCEVKGHIYCSSDTQCMLGYMTSVLPQSLIVLKALSVQRM